MACAFPAFLVVAPDLVEESVLRELDRQDALGKTAPGEEYRSAREWITEGSEIPIDAASRLLALHQEWFHRLGFGSFLRQSLAEVPALGIPPGGVRVERAFAHREQGADLFRPLGPFGRRGDFTIVICIQPESFGFQEALRSRLRRDLVHVADMLDPEFGYEPDLSPDLELPVRNLLRDRIFVLWAISVAERARRIWPGEQFLTTVDSERLLTRAFSGLSAAEIDDLGEFVRSAGRPAYSTLVRRAGAGIRAVSPGSAAAPRRVIGPMVTRQRGGLQD